MPTPAIAALAATMIAAGTINTIATKLQDTTVLDDGEHFFHPALQSAFMFAGEALCLVGAGVSLARTRAAAEAAGRPRPPHRATPRAVLAFALPAACDAAATTALNVGLALTSASTFQMLRGTLVAWAGLFTQVLLRRRLRAHHWFGVVLIAAGAAVVGAASIVYEGGAGGGLAAAAAAARHPAPPPPPPRAGAGPGLGVALIVGSQAVTALQFIVEEAFLAQHRVPALLAVGLEGAWGLGLCAAALPALSALRVGARPVDDWRAGLAQVLASPRLRWSSGLTIVSIAAFNACGLAVTKRLSGAGRAATDAVRTLAVWAASLAAGWEAFAPCGPLKLLGFALLLTGSALFNGLVRACLPAAAAAAAADEEEAAAASDPLLAGDGGGGPAAAPAPPRPRAGAGAASAPVRAVRTSRQQHYSLARSARLAPSALEPHSLLDATPTGGFGSSVGGDPTDSEVESVHGQQGAGEALAAGRRAGGV